MRAGIWTVVAIAALALAPGASAADKEAKFDITSLDGTMTSTYTGTFAPTPPDEPIERQETECTVTWTETVSFSAAQKRTAFVSRRRSHGMWRTVWSLTKKPFGPFTSVPVRGDATVSRSITRSPSCRSEDCSGTANSPWIHQFTGTREANGGALMAGAFQTSDELMSLDEGCPYGGGRALAPLGDDIDFDDPAPHLFEAKALFNPRKQTLTDSETFSINWSNKWYAGTSTVELTGTLKRRTR
jgi:hypothetical protein